LQRQKPLRGYAKRYAQNQLEGPIMSKRNKFPIILILLCIMLSIGLFTYNIYYKNGKTAYERAIINAHSRESDLVELEVLLPHLIRNINYDELISILHIQYNLSDEYVTQLLDNKRTQLFLGGLIFYFNEEYNLVNITGSSLRILDIYKKNDIRPPYTSFMLSGGNIEERFVRGTPATFGGLLMVLIIVISIYYFIKFNRNKNIISNIHYSILLLITNIFLAFIFLFIYNYSNIVNIFWWFPEVRSLSITNLMYGYTTISIFPSLLFDLTIISILLLIFMMYQYSKDFIINNV
jgi:hypothetical protein